MNCGASEVIEWLPHINVSLNSLACVLLVIGFVLIKQKKERAHRNVMIATFIVSALFLACYLTYHFQVPSKKFPTDTNVAPVAARYFYYALLASHVVLAMSVPFLAIAAIVYGLKDNRPAHRRVVRYAWPIWLYVSVTGVMVYLMLYQIYVPK
ncbi:MAG: DUF420 domain-containing protein [Pirellulaceae bacterium]|nr:DUF420 domain-containing protein [Pirellulaceae bacterium]